MGKKTQLENYWSDRYINQSTGWDLGEVSPPLQSYFDQLTNKELKILIPGAGNAYEAEYLFNKGFNNVYIIDVADQPLLDFKKRVPDFPSKQIIKGDFFELNNQFDLIVEQTFFCSFPPINNQREMYVDKMNQLLKPKGKLLGLWFNIPLTNDLEKRPFGGSKDLYISLFEPKFKVISFENCYNSIASRAGKEFFGIFKK